jgi:hypothetical protein
VVASPRREIYSSEAPDLARRLSRQRAILDVNI